MSKLKNKKLRDPNLVYSYTFSLPTSALKARRVIDAIRGRTYEDAIKIIKGEDEYVEMLDFDNEDARDIY